MFIQLNFCVINLPSPPPPRLEGGSVVQHGVILQHEMIRGHLPNSSSAKRARFVGSQLFHHVKETDVAVFVET